MAGWVKIYDKFTDWEWFGKSEMVQIFIYMLLRANYKDTEWRGVKLNRGQFITSRAEISKVTGLSDRQIRTCLERLEMTGEITLQATNRFTLVTVCKYDSYQDVSNSERPASDQQNDQRTTSKATSETTSKKSKLKNRKSSTYREKKNISDQRNDQQDVSKTTSKATTDKDDKTKDNKISIEPYVVKASPVIKAEEIKGMWNSICKAYPRLLTISDSRRNKMRLRIDEMGGGEQAYSILQNIFQKMQDSDFLRGQNRRGWRASFDWVFENDKNWVKIFEGNYDNRKDDENGNNREFNTEKQKRDQEFAQYITQKLSR